VPAASPTATSAPTDSLRRVEFWILAALLFCLPLFEAPKNILWALYVLVWLANHARARDFGGRWDAWDTLLAAWIASGALAAAFAGLHHREWNGVFDLLRYGSVLWLLKRSRFEERDILVLLAALALGTVVTLVHGYWRLEVAGTRKRLELKSVGHVNHSAIYLAIMLGAAVSAVAAYWHRLGAARRALAAALLALFAISLFVMESRTAVLVAGALVVLIAVAWWPRARVMSFTTLAAVVVVGLIAVVGHVDVVKKHEREAAAGDVLSYRLQIWNTARAAWQRFPFFGVGMDNYSVIPPEAIPEWRKQAGKPYDEKDYLVRSGHAHSLYYNTLAERGTVGFAALAAVLIAWLWRLARRYPGRAGGDATWALWGGALSAWFVTVFAGIGNTTLHSEHALLAMILLGLWMAYTPRGA
jgi:O-antigen ligase